MSSLDQQIQNASDKLQQFLKKHELVLKENKRLLKDNHRIRGELDLKNEYLTKLQQKIDAIKLNSANMNDEGVKKDLEKRITIYLKEIDKCLALLNA